MEYRVCNQCLLEKDIDIDFYETTPSRCKECVKANARARELINTSTPKGLEKERERHRSKYHRLGYKELQKEWDENKPWKNSNVYKGLRKKSYKNLPRNFELHHWNYNDEYLEDVFILNIRDHKNLHNYLSLDIEKRVFYITENNKYLDTKEKHLEYIKELEIEIYKK